MQMWRGIPVSILLHAVIVAGGTIAWPYFGPRYQEIEFVAVPIELLELSDETNVTASLAREEPEEEDAPEPPPLQELLEQTDVLPDEEVVEDDEPTAREEQPDPAPAEAEEEVILPEDAPEEAPEPAEEETPEEPPAEDEPAEPEPVRVDPEPEPDALDSLLSESANLFDKQRQERPAAPPAQPVRELQDETRQVVERRGAGDRTGNTQSVVNMLYAQLYICWDDVDDLPNPERLNVTLRMRLNPDGSLDGPVRLVKPTRAPIGDRAMGVAIERALRAARKCAPYRLPPEAMDDYEEWRNVVLNIGPAFRGQ